MESHNSQTLSPAATTPLKVLGICIGASTISLVELIQHTPETDQTEAAAASPAQISHFALHTHDGNPKAVLREALQQLDMTAYDRVAATGRKFRHFVNLSSIAEPEAVEYAYRFVKPPRKQCPAVVSAGGETFMVYKLDNNGRISNVLTGNKCASGTGEFFLQQLRRMNVSLEEAAQWASTETPHHVSGRCSVFCKSDCTHATNKGVPKSNVTAGLCQMMANKILELLKKIERRDIMLTGGTSRNRMMVEYLQKEIPGLIVPEQAPYFEALGAALWAIEHETRPYPGDSALIRSEISAFDRHAPLADFEDMVTFETIEQGDVRSDDTCIIGLDVGSTTTKAILMRESDDAILASIYLRTDGDPVGASRKCYAALHDQISAKVNLDHINIIGLGVCGSGRQIAGLHALTEGVINEIIAHAAAAVYFDPEVDTIFEIGGQDAKYTYITNAVPSDYAMNEACSAGTGSFLEESALETLGVEMEDIAEVALKGKIPPNFNDQCAAFIASDIKNAIHEGVEHEDIIAGLVYSISMNYTNRVKGNRPVGDKVFMQGGVCYNRAVPLAMAALVGKPIIVPPEPGLMGAFGVALEIKNRLASGLIKYQTFDLRELMAREVRYAKSFTCKGGKEKCDRRCEIAMIEVEGQKHPFGGACNRYYNLRHNVRYNVSELDLVRIRQELVFGKYAGQLPEGYAANPRGRIGFNRSFLVNTYFPLYSTFFAELGYEVTLPDEPAQEGIDQRNAAFCYPAELAHGFFHDLLTQNDPPDFIFLPHFRAVPDHMEDRNAQVCPLVQGETFFLQSTFKKPLSDLKRRGVKLLTPLMDLTFGLDTAEEPLVAAARQMGISRKEARRAFGRALEQQHACQAEMKAIGAKALAALEETPDRSAVVIFARPYNGFVEEAHMGIPHKIASRGVLVMPFDFLDLKDTPAKRHMFWGMGQILLKAARVVKAHPQLFGTFITNFSCGPDSFVTGYFRDIMGRKPSLTLELDSHTADAGLETRIEAFIDIVSAYRQLVAQKMITTEKSPFTPARVIIEDGVANVTTSNGEILPLVDPRITLLMPSMGRLITEGFAAIMRAAGVHAKAHPASDEAVLKLGRGNTSCKECLPLILTTGTLLNYIRNGKRPEEVVVYFFGTSSGPCRFGQYAIFMEDLIRRLAIPDVAILTLSGENSYMGMDDNFDRRAWWAVVVSDIMEDIRSMLLANAAHVTEALEQFETEWQAILEAFEVGTYDVLEAQLEKTAASLKTIPLKRAVREVPIVALTGEIFVRRDALSRQYLTERLAEKGFATICAPVTEWVQYCNFMVQKEFNNHGLSPLERFKFHLRHKFQNRYERRIKTIFAESGLVHPEPIDIASIVKVSEPYISTDLQGEAVLTVGGALADVATHACGVIAIGPFGCMPNRLSEAILNDAMSREGKLAANPRDADLRTILTDIENMPFLAIESDGSPFPQLINAQLEAFSLRAQRLHRRMQHGRRRN